MMESESKLSERQKQALAAVYVYTHELACMNREPAVTLFVDYDGGSASLRSFDKGVDIIPGHESVEIGSKTVRALDRRRYITVQLDAEGDEGNSSSLCTYAWKTYKIRLTDKGASVAEKLLQDGWLECRYHGSKD